MSDEELIDRLAQQAQIDDGDRALLWQTYRRIVAVTFQRLTEAGRLLPPVVETREEWAERCWRHGEGWCFPYGEHLEREPGDTHVRTVTKHADGSEHFGPWREVSP